MATVKKTAKTDVKVSDAVAPAKKKFEQSDLIPCRSITHGELVMIGKKSNIHYSFANIGDVTEIEYQDLQALYVTKSPFLMDPMFIIEDEEIVEQWKSILKPVYEKVADEDLDELLNMQPNQMKAALSVLPKGVHESVKSLAAAKIQSGELDSLNRIRAIDEVFGTDFASMI